MRHEKKTSSTPPKAQEPGRASRFWRRLWRTGLLVSCALVLLLFGIAASLLYTERGQQWVTAVAVRQLHEATGLRLSLGEWRLDPGERAIEIRDLTLASEERGEFVRVERVTARLRWRQLLRREVVVENLTLERPLLDLAAWPSLPESRASGEADAGGLEIRQLQVRDGRILGAPLGPASREPSQLPRLERWSLEDLDAEGSLHLGPGGGFTLTPVATLSLRGPGLDDPEFDLSARLSGPSGGAVVVEQFHLSGEGTELAGSAVVGLEQDQPLNASFSLDALPSLWLEDPRTGASRLVAQGDVDLRTASGQVEATASEVPGELLGAFLSETMASALSGTVFDGAITLDDSAENRTQAPGKSPVAEGRLSWRTLERPLANATFEVRAHERRESGLPELDRLALDLHASAPSLPVARFAALLPTQHRETLSAAGLIDTDAALEVDLVYDPGAARLSANGSLHVVDEHGGSSRLRIGASRLSASLTPSLGTPSSGAAAGTPVAADRALAGFLTPDLSTASGTLALAFDLPADLAQRFVPELAPASSDSESTAWTRRLIETGDRLEGTADLVLRDGRLEPVPTVGSVTWWRPEPRGEGPVARVLARLELSGLPAPPGNAGSVSLELLVLPRDTPADALARVDVSLLASESWLTRATAGQIELEGRAAIETPSLREALDRLEATWPGIVPRGTVPTVLEAGSLSIAASFDGSLAQPDGTLAATWLGQDGSRISLEAGGHPLTRVGRLESELDLRRLSDWLPAATPDDPPNAALEWTQALEHASATGRWHLARATEGSFSVGSASESEVSPWHQGLTGAIEARVNQVTWRTDTADTALELSARLEDGVIQVDRLGVDSPLEAVASSEPEDRLHLQATGEIGLPDDPARDLPTAHLTLTHEGALAGLERSHVDLALLDGHLTLRSQELVTSLGSGSLELSLPLSLLAGEGALGDFLGSRGVATGEDTLEVVASLPRLELFTPGDPGLGGEGQAGPPAMAGPDAPEPGWLRLEGLELDLSLDPRDLLASRGVLRIQSLEASQARESPAPSGQVEPAVTLTAPEPVVVTLDGGRATLAPSVFLVLGQPIEVALVADLSRQWSGGDSLSQVVAKLEASASGVIDLASLNPYLLGGRGQGLAQVDAELHGPVDGLEGRLTLVGETATVSFIRPYATRFSDLRAEMTLAEGILSIGRLDASLNRGQFHLAGEVDSGRGRTDLDMTLEEVRYRVDYGIATTLSGELRLGLPLGVEPPLRRGSLEGELTVDRGLLRRDIDLEREVLAILFAPVDAASSAGELSERLDLDLTVRTRDGLRVRNNVADLRVLWSPLRVRGTMAEPLLDGVFDVEPGGLITAYGQTIRLDKATARLRGRPGAEPELDLITTSSLQDPSVSRRGAASDLDPFSEPEQVEPGGGIGGAATTGLASYLGDRLAGSASRSLGAVLPGSFTIRPVLLFNESEPTARLLVTRDVTDNVAAGASINMRTAENRTYLLDFHEFAPLPRFSGQVFTNDQANEGVTAQQVFELGGGAADRRKVGRITVEFVGKGADLAPSRRALLNALTLDRGDEFHGDADYDLEIDAGEFLARRGFPDADVTVEVSERGWRRDVRFVITPGPYAEVSFEGLRPSARSRRAIAGAYHTDFYELASLEEMRRLTRTTLQRNGWVDPKVEIEVRTDDRGTRHVRVDSSSERSVKLDEIEFNGVDRATAAILSEALPGRAVRIDLLIGTPSAKELLLGRLESLGWPRAQIETISATGDGKRLEVSIIPGPRAHVGSVLLELAHLDDESAPDVSDRAAPELPNDVLTRLQDLNTVTTGDPLDRRAIALVTASLETALRELGYDDARALARIPDPVVPEGEAQIPDVAVTVLVDPGAQYHLGSVDVVNNRHANTRWVSGISDLDTGETLAPELLATARRRLLSTGVFSTVWLDTVKHPSGEVDLELRVDERPRYRLGYGLRWETEEGLGLVVDALDRDFLGRGIEVGARALWTADFQSARIYSNISLVAGSRYSFETFAEVSEENEDGFLIDSLELSLQLSRPLSRYGTGRTYGRYRREHFTDSLLPIDTTVRSPYLGLQYLWTDRGGGFATEDGIFASADLSGSDDFLGSDFSYLRFFGQVFYVRPAFELGSRRFEWAQGYRIGVARAFDEELLRDQRFFAGGEYSVRGYPTESLGPILELGDRQIPLGGDSLFVINQELRFPLKGRFGGLAFLDAGNVWDKTLDFEGGLRTALGLGLRMNSPIGLLRLDVGFPLDRREGDPSSRIYFGLGNVF